MVVHFPIAFWVAGTVVWGVALVRRKDPVWHAGLWLHTAGALTALVAVAFGFLGTSIMGHDGPSHDLVHVHRDIMLVATALAIALTATAWWRRASSVRQRSALFVVAVLQMAIMTIGSDRGAALVFQHGIGVDWQSPPSSAETMHEH